MKELGIPIRNIYLFFTDAPEKESCKEVELHEDFITGIVEFKVSGRTFFSFFGVKHCG